MTTALGDTRLRIAEIARQPTTLALLVLLPPVVIETYGIALASFPQLPGVGGDPATVGRMTGTLFAVAFLAGLVGLFQVISARSGDERLALCGYSPARLLATRIATLVAVTAVGGAVAFLVFVSRVDVAAPAIALAVMGLAGLLYGLIGVIVGTLLPRELEGSLVLVFLADVDNALSSGLFDLGGGIARFAPLYHPHALFRTAVQEGDVADGHLLPTLALVGGLLVVAVVAYQRSAHAVDGGRES